MSSSATTTTSPDEEAEKTVPGSTGPSVAPSSTSESLNSTMTTSGPAQASPSAKVSVVPDDIRVILKIPGEKEEIARNISKDTEYELSITRDGETFIGAVQLNEIGVPEGDVDPPINLIPVAACISDPNQACTFTPADALQTPARRYESIARREQISYNIKLNRIPTIMNDTYYELNLTWATVRNPVLGSWDDEARVRYSIADDPELGGKMVLVFLHDTSSGVKDGGGLSTGAKAGIAVGAVLGVLAIFALIFLCMRRRKSKRATAGGYFGDAPGSNNDIREKEAGVGIAAIPVSSSSASGGNRHSVRPDAALIGRGNSAKVVDGATMERGDGVGRHATTGHAAATPAAAAAAATVARKPVGNRTVSDEERGAERDGAISAEIQVLSDEERARWEEEERRLDEDIAEAERRRLA